VYEVAKRGGNDLPCAYTEFATCPLPQAENRLPAAVEAHEQIWPEVLAAADGLFATLARRSPGPASELAEAPTGNRKSSW
jgi:hypothetical protein